MEYEGQICRGAMERTLFEHLNYRELSLEQIEHELIRVKELNEENHLIELLSMSELEYDGFHDFISFRVKGRLPKDREKMLQKLMEKIKGISNADEQLLAIVD